MNMKMNNIEPKEKCQRKGLNDGGSFLLFLNQNFKFLSYI